MCLAVSRQTLVAKSVVLTPFLSFLQVFQLCTSWWLYQVWCHGTRLNRASSHGATLLVLSVHGLAALFTTCLWTWSVERLFIINCYNLTCLEYGLARVLVRFYTKLHASCALYYHICSNTGSLLTIFSIFCCRVNYT